jgi:hypothetical protein
MSPISDIPFQQLIDALSDLDTPLNPRFLYRLSDLEADDLKQLKPIWLELPLWRRKALIEDVEELGATDYLLDFMAFGELVIDDADPGIRLMAVRTLWEYEQSELIPVFLGLIEKDPDAEVRAAAATGLGRFIYAGEIEEIPASKLKKLEEALLKLVESGEVAQVRRAALESLGFSSREEVSPLIQKAFDSSDRSWKASALFAMGRSANQAWKPAVLSMLVSPIPLLRGEAARAAGELEINEAVPLLLEMLDDPDDNTRSASIWSLSQIGGEDVREALERLYEEAEDEEEIEFLDSALENLTFTEGVKFMPFFDFPDELESEAEEDEWYSDLEEMDDLLDEEEDRSD